MKAETFEKTEVLHILIPKDTRLKLEHTAIKNGITMSWLVRSILAQFRKNRTIIPILKRPRKFECDHVSFSLVVYGNKGDLQMYARMNGCEFSPLIRYALELWEIGLLFPDLQKPSTNKSIKDYKTGQVNELAPMIKKIAYFQKIEYWPKNENGNLYLMIRGLLRRKHPL